MTDRKGPRKLKKCVYPFKFNSTTYTTCTDASREEGTFWCSTKVDKDGVYIEGEWGFCDADCNNNNIKGK